MGEIRRYFRDNSWNVHVPRGMQELALRVARTSRALTERTGNSPTAAAIADELGEPEERVLEALSLDEINRPLSLDGVMQAGDADRPSVLEHCLGEEDRSLTEAEHRVSVDQMLNLLPAVLREVIQLRYLDQLSQRETGRRLGLSQMQVSRLERRALETMRGELVLN
jgi:RNA polymerase sigma-B factor